MVPGAPSVQLLDECGVYWHHTDAILAVLPRIATARDALSRRLRLLHPLYETNRFELLAADLKHRDLAALSGDPTTAAKWQAIIDRKVAALADKDRAIATSLWSSFFR